VASVDRASHLSIHLSSSTGINPHASVGGRGGGGDGQRPPPSVGEGGQAVRWGISWERSARGEDLIGELPGAISERRFAPCDLQWIRFR
jgi:hypothetical protein